MAPPGFTLNQRLSYNGTLCTVRYQGSLPGTSGQWLGVEWDSDTHGKHDGTHKGVRYFRCLSRSRTAGSFIRPSRPHDAPRSFLDALRDKYVAVPDESGDAKTVLYFNGKLAEEVGFDKVAAQQADLGELKVVVLDGWCVAGLNADGQPIGDYQRDGLVQEVRETCGKIEELDLSRCVIADWSHIVGICLGLPKLKKLTLDGNRFTGIESMDIDQCRKAFAGLEELSLNGTLLRWNEIISIAEALPSLKSLSLASNDLQPPFSHLPNIQLLSLNLSFNPLSFFDSILPFASLPHLSSLTLRACSINNLTRIEQPFQALTHLDLASNDISTLEDLNHIPPSFPALLSLRSSSNPFYTNLPPDEAFMFTLSRIPTLTQLNFSHISTQERDNAELYYLSRIRSSIAANPKLTGTTLRQHHPQLDYLASKHKQTEDIADAEHAAEEAAQQSQSSTANDRPINPHSLGAQLLELTFTTEHTAKPTPASPSANPISNSPSSPSTSEFTLTLPRSTSMYRLKSRVGRHIDLLPRFFTLIWETGEMDPVGRNIRNPGRVGEGEKIADAESEEEDDRLLGDTRDVNDTSAVQRADRRGDAVRWIRREVELAESTRPLGFWMEGRTARVRVEVRRGARH